MSKTAFSPIRRLPQATPWPLLLGLAVAGLAGDRATAQGPPGEPPPAPVVVAEVHRCDVPVGPTFVGTVKPKRTSLVGSQVEGRVVELLVDEGQHVAQLQPLAKLRTESLDIELAAARAELKLLELESEQLKISQPMEIEQAEARMLAAEALHKFAEHRLKRNQDLSKDNANIITEDVLEELSSAADAGQNVLQERTTGWKLTQAVSPKQIAKAEARIHVQRKNIRKLQDDIAQHTILAPFDGYVTRKHTEVGQWIAKGGPIVDVVELSEVDVEVPVLETYVRNLRARNDDKPGTGTVARQIRVDALPGETFSGEVVAVVPEADVRSRSFPVKVRVTNRPGKKAPESVMLKPGMFVRVDLPLGLENSMLVPKDAVVLGGPSPMVWLVRRQSEGKLSGLATVSPVPVELGIAMEDWIEVAGPLEAGQEVVVEGNERIKPGAPVRVIKAINFDDRRSGDGLRSGRE
jgi:RND family efflux transporter MFP subunit